MKIHGFDVGHLSNDRHFQSHTEVREAVEKENENNCGFSVNYIVFTLITASIIIAKNINPENT